MRLFNLYSTWLSVIAFGSRLAHCGHVSRNGRSLYSKDLCLDALKSIISYLILESANRLSAKCMHLLNFILPYQL